jgi:hypothetical protein
MSRFSLCVLLPLAACTVADEPYPADWAPLPQAASSSCRHFSGSYADRGEAPGHANKPSLTRELFGQDSPWEKAVSVQFDVPRDDTLDVVVSAPGGPPFNRRLTTQGKDFSCERGRLVEHSRRWVASDLMSGRETVKIEIHHAEPHLAARVNESITGVMFMVVPLSGESSRWYRFSRIP